MISVIVPVYNVEKYIRKCLESLKDQTFQDAEFVIVDDGSTDGSGAIADEYGDDPRFRIIHTNENRGLSAARNTGIDEARGDWLMFVDSDDWVDRKFCEIPYKAAEESGADLVIFGSCEVEHGRARVRKRQCVPAGLTDAGTAVEYGDTFAWNKLYKYDLFSDIRYPVGKVYEDIAVTHKIVFKAERILMLEETLYYHVKRKESISQMPLAENKRNGFEFALQRYNDLNSYGLPSERHVSTLYSYALSFLALTPPCADELYHKAEEICDSIKGIPNGLTIKKQIMLLAWKIHKNLFFLLCRMMRQNVVRVP